MHNLSSEDGVMSLTAYEETLAALAGRLRLAEAPTADLMAEIAAKACARLPLLNKAGKAARLYEFIGHGAWTDATLILIAFELPAWQLRRLTHDGGEWLCSLSRQPQLPVELDDTADGRHPVLALAILAAFLDARCRIGAERGARAQTVPQVKSRSSYGYTICCDNFS